MSLKALLSSGVSGNVTFPYSCHYFRNEVLSPSAIMTWWENRFIIKQLFSSCFSLVGKQNYFCISRFGVNNQSFFFKTFQCPRGAVIDFIAFGRVLEVKRIGVQV
jgi:hypothetical protein